MKTFVFLLLLTLANAKTFQRCEWARVLKDHQMDAISGTTLADWVCLTKWESGYKTNQINHNTDGSTDYGIFQINSRWWCNDDRTRTRNACNIKCNQLLTDDVAVAIDCAKRVVRDPRGLRAWVAWTTRCQNRDLSSYIAGCDL